jgi:hypothetical protein
MRCPGRPASGRSRFGVSSRRRPARILMRPADADDLLCALAVFRCERIRCDEARVADVYWPERSNRIRRLAATGTAFRHDACLARRRVDGLLLRRVRLRSAVQVRPVKPIRATRADDSLGIDSRVVTLADDPYHSSAFAKTPPPGMGHSPSRLFAWRSATRPELAALSHGQSHTRPGRATQVFPLFVARRRSWGSTRPSQVYSRERVDAPRKRGG